MMRDPGKLALRRACRVALVIPAVFALSTYGLGLGLGALYATIGAFVLLALADFGGPTRTRAEAYVAAGGLGVVAIAVGTLAAENRIAAVITTFVFVFGLSLGAVLRGYFAASAVAVLLPFVIAVTSGPGGTQHLLNRGLGWIVGAAFALASALLLWPSHRRGALRVRLSAALSATASVVRATWPSDDQTPSLIDVDGRMRELTQAFHGVHEVYDGRLIRPGDATSHERAAMQLVDQIGRIRTLLMWRSHEHAQPMSSDVALARLSADCLDGCARALTTLEPPPDPTMLDEARKTHQRSLEEWARDRLVADQGREVADRLDAGFRVRVVAALSELACISTREASGHKTTKGSRAAWDAATVPVSTIDVRLGRKLRDHLSFGSPWFRNSFRSAVAVTLAVLLAAAIGVDHGIWVVLGAVVALRFDVIGTSRSAVQVVVGTVGGFLIVLLLITAVGAESGAYWLLLPLVAFLAAYAAGAVSKVVAMASSTVFALVFLSLVFGYDVKTGEVRIINVGLGLAVSLAMSALLWPRGVTAQVRTTLAAAIHECGGYLVGAYDRLLEGPLFDDEAVTLHRRASSALNTSYEAFDLSLSQPGPKAINTQAWAILGSGATQVLAGANRVVALARAGYQPSGCPDAADTLIATAHHVRAQLDYTIDRLASLEEDLIEVADPSTDRSGAPTRESALDDPVLRLRHRVRTCLESWQHVTDRDVGHDALALVWAQDWLVHLDWVAHGADTVFVTRNSESGTHSDRTKAAE